MLNEKAGEIEKQSGTTEVVDTSHAAAAEDTVGEKESSTNFGRFKSAAELLNAYNSLESEFNATVIFRSLRVCSRKKCQEWTSYTNSQISVSS